MTFVNMWKRISMVNIQNKEKLVAIKDLMVNTSNSYTIFTKSEESGMSVSHWGVWDNTDGEEDSDFMELCPKSVEDLKVILEEANQLPGDKIVYRESEKCSLIFEFVK